MLLFCRADINSKKDGGVFRLFYVKVVPLCGEKWGAMLQENFLRSHQGFDSSANDKGGIIKRPGICRREPAIFIKLSKTTRVILKLITRSLACDLRLFQPVEHFIIFEIPCLKVVRGDLDLNVLIPEVIQKRVEFDSA